MRRPWIAVALAVTMVVALRAQAPKPTFEVASVKRSPRPTGIAVVSAGRWQTGRWSASLATLKQLIETAYPGHTMPGQLIGGPNWLSSDRFDIVATAPPASSPDEIRVMLRSLLSDRFRLTLHTEQRDLPVYRLVLARENGQLGPDLKPAEMDCDTYDDARDRGETPPLARRPGEPAPCTISVQPTATLTRIVARGVTMGSLVSALSTHVGRPVIDGTALRARFDASLEMSEKAFSSEQRDPAVADASSIFNTLQRQWGLKLEPGRGPVEVLVIDSVQQPTEN